MNLEKITNQICRLSREAGMYIKQEAGKLQSRDIQEKNKHDYVTTVDKAAESQIIARLSEIVPEAGFIAEESPNLEKKEAYNWIVDPLDGTTNFIHQIPLFAISIALMFRNEVLAGVVYEINQDECFYASKNKGTYLNGKPVKTSTTSKLENSLLATGFPFYNYSRLEEYLQLFKHMMQHSRGVRRLGSAAVDLAYVACGRFDGFYEYGLNAWDVAAGSLLVKEAGGLNFDFMGEGNYIFGKEIISCNSSIQNELKKAIYFYFA